MQAGDGAKRCAARRPACQSSPTVLVSLCCISTGGEKRWGLTECEQWIDECREAEVGQLRVWDASQAVD